MNPDTGRQVVKTLERIPLMQNEAHEFQTLSRYDFDASEGYLYHPITTVF
jgi:hypothetical protein